MRGYRNRFPVSIARRDLLIVDVRLAQLSKGAEDPGAYCNVASSSMSGWKVTQGLR